MYTPLKLITKYNRPGPRYTSYPPVPFWSNTPDESTWIEHIKHRYDGNKGVDLYVHIPYCESLCYYCGCSRTITKDHSVEENFLALVLKEWKLYQDKLGFTPKIHSLHLGGGTPTFLSPDNLNHLIKNLLKMRNPDFIGSIELDPRTCQSEHLDVLFENGIERVSLGIQDFDPEVQKLIHRFQSPELIRGLVSKISEKGIRSVNFDLIHGLPGQTKESIEKTLKIVTELRPDLIAFYSYAHLPEKIKNQKLIKNELLPSPEKKRELYEVGRILLREFGYHEIGMDHFALPSSFLYRAKEQNQLHRNFMGHVDKKSNVLIGLGPTSISDSSMSFAQNCKEMKEYEKRILCDHLPIEKGHTHSDTDLIIQEIILDLICKSTASMSKGIIPYADEIMTELLEFQEDGIVELKGNKITITELGKAFTRNVAMTFDYHLRARAHSTQFSQTI